MSEEKQGRIVRSISGFYDVALPEGILTCQGRGILRKEGLSPLTGDLVTVTETRGKGMIQKVLPRKNSFIRPAVANVDALVIFAANVNPITEPFLIDRVAAIAGNKGVETLLCVNKTDLDEASELVGIYRHAGFRVIPTSAQTGAGVEELRKALQGKLTAFTGNSGVGKSTLLNALLPDVERQTAAISQKLGRGRHTTREVTIFEAFGGRIADTPGFASLEASRAGFIPKEALEHAFPEFGPYLGACQFTGCSHRSEKGCAVRAALAEGRLSQTRYDSYCAMYDEVKDVKDWQRPKV